MTKKKKIHAIDILFLPFRFLYRIILSVCILYSYLKDIMIKIVYYHNIEEMSGIEFEIFCQELLKNNSFHHVELTKASNDYGVDILAMKNCQLYAIQCKKYKSKVGIEAVRQVATGCTYYDQDIAVVLTNSTFSSQAINLAKILDVELWDQQKLQLLMKKSKQTKKRKRILFLLFLTILLVVFFLLK